jgi:hypothetical protein
LSDRELSIDWRGADGERLAALRQVFLARSEGGVAAASDDYWRDRRDLELYDATFGARIGWKWDEALAEGAHCGATPARNPARSVIDLGTGSGVAVRRALAAGWIEPGAEVCLVDRSARAREFAAERLREAEPRLSIRSVAHVAPFPCELLLGSHLLGELAPADFDAAVELARAAQTVVWVEPGSRPSAAALVELREALRGELHPLAPCPHSGPCPLAQARTDWCHHFAEPPAEAFTSAHWTRFAQTLGVDLRSLTLSYLVLDRTPPPARDPQLVRLLGRPRLEKGKAQVDLCTARGQVRAELWKRDAPATWRAWRKGPGGRTLHCAEWDGRRLRPLPPSGPAAPFAGQAAR